MNKLINTNHQTDELEMTWTAEEQSDEDDSAAADIKESITHMNSFALLQC